MMLFVMAMFISLWRPRLTSAPVLPFLRFSNFMLLRWPHGTKMNITNAY